MVVVFLYYLKTKTNTRQKSVRLSKVRNKLEEKKLECKFN